MKFDFLINKLISRNIIKPEEADIYVYGLEYSFLYLINILLSAFLSIMIHGTILYIFVLLTFIPLRRFAGGFHFNNPLVCMFFSQLFILIPQIIIPHITEYQKELIFLFIIAFPLLFFITIKKRAVSSKKKYIDEFLIKRYTRKALIIEIIYSLLFIGFIIFKQTVFAAVILYIVIIQFFLILIPEK